MSEQDKNTPTPTQVPEEITKILRQVLAQQSSQKIASVYANTIHFESSELDFKLLLGQISQFPGNPEIEWRTAVTFPWAQAKLLSYYLRINLKIYESQHGTIQIPATMFPAAPIAPTDIDTNPSNKAVFEFVQRIQRELVDELVEKSKT